MTGSTDDSNSDDCQLQSETLSLSSIEELESNDEFGFEHPTQEQPTKGSECTIQTLYEGPQECKCCTNWVEEYPGDLRKAVEDKPETKQKALVVRMAKSHEDGKLLVMDSIVVQSPSLKKTLGEVFEGYKGITASLKKLVFKAPFHEFYYRWGRLSEILERQRRDDPVAATYTQLLYDVLGAELADLRLEIVDLLFHGVITYPHLWAIFEPGALIVKKFDDYEQFYIAQNCEYGLGVLHVNASLIDWDGTRFGYESVTHEINAFSGTQAIEDLVVLPASSHPSRSQAEAKAIARGRQFRELRGVHYKAYSGRINYTVQGRGNTRALERNVSMYLGPKSMKTPANRSVMNRVVDVLLWMLFPTPAAQNMASLISLLLTPTPLHPRSPLPITLTGIPLVLRSILWGTGCGTNRLWYRRTCLVS